MMIKDIAVDASITIEKINTADIISNNAEVHLIVNTIKSMIPVKRVISRMQRGFIKKRKEHLRLKI